MSSLVRASFAFESDGNMIHLLPLGSVRAVDARTFRVSNPAQVIASSAKNLLVDYDHSSELYGVGASTRAAGWVSGLQLRSSGIWGRVQWTPDGQRDIDSQSYRYLSPVIELNNPEEREVISICSVAVTNRPALSQLAAIGDVSTYRESVRLACSRAMTPDLSGVPKGVLARCRRDGISDVDIARAVAFNDARNAATADPSENELREACMARGGMTAEAFDSARRFAAAARGERT
ncbi:MAG: Mu-like prophage protein [Myxococcaceae bacterium]|nr:Mu-like prophage protein [Myxococcaceae bacterium]